ncbi:MAG: AbrB/MazE/SpoVT family DNA-binding domain-containing protein [Methanosarcinales archaeon]
MMIEIVRNGNISIPKDLRDKFGITDGSYIELKEKNNGIQLVKLDVGEKEFSEVISRLAELADKKGITMKDIIKASRKRRKEIYAEEFGD